MHSTFWTRTQPISKFCRPAYLLKVLFFFGLITTVGQLSAQSIPSEITVYSRVVTGKVVTDADDPAIWIHPTNPELSLVIGTDKSGHLVFVWDMNGRELQRIPVTRRPNNGDVRYGMPVGGMLVDIYAVGAEGPSRIVIFKIDPNTRQLTDITATNATLTPQVKEPYGFCLYRRAQDGAMYAFVNSIGGTEGILNQYLLTDNGTGKVKATFVRSFYGTSYDKHSEGMVADDELGYVYIAEEDSCVRKFHANPDMGNAQLAAFAYGDGIEPDREGLGLYTAPDGTGYILLSSQGNQRIKVYRREGDAGNPHSHSLVTTIYTPGVGSTDGLDVTSRPAGPNFPHGLIAKHDGGTGFSLFAWEDVAQSYLSVASITADFSANLTTGCAPLAVTFTDQSTGPVTSWEWDFGDGNTSTSPNPTHEYAAAGTYTVTLKTTNAFGFSQTMTRADYIAAGTAPTAAFLATPVSGLPPMAVSFHDQSTQNPTSWLWDFGDGTTSTEQHPTHEYAVAGSYTVTLTATNSCGSQSETKTAYITVNSPVEAEFTHAGAGQQALTNFATVAGNNNCAPLEVQFMDQSTGDPTSWLWNFGDGNTSTEQNPIHTYANPGSYTVTLTASSATGNDIETKINYITVESAPQAAFEVTPTVFTVLATVNFTNQSTSNSASYLWDFGDDNTSTEPNPAHQYTTPGVYTVSLTVSNDCGSHTETKQNHITIVDTVAAQFSADLTSGCAPLAIQFSDQSTGPVTSWLWDFGDGSTSNEQHPSHTYAAAGKYTVQLTVTNTANGSSTKTIDSFVSVYLKPSAAFTANSTSGNVPVTVTFTDQSAGNPTSWLWDFGDGTTSTEQNPSHTYTVAGDYTVQLTITNECDASTTTQANYLRFEPCIKPLASFSAATTSGSVPFTVNFTDQSSGNPASWLWDFGDGNTSTEQNPAHQYAAPGNYTVALTVSNGCDTHQDTKQDYVSVIDTVSAEFTADVTAGCGSLAVQFTDQSTGPVAFWLWDFGDGATSNEQNPSHTYAAAGNYTVKLTITNSVNWSSTETKSDYIQIGVLTTAAFIASSTTGEIPLAVTFTDQSTGNPTSWLWDFGDGTTSAEQNPTHTYTAVGEYTVQLTVTNACGEASETKTNYIRATPCTVPVASFAAEPTSGSVPLAVKFMDQSTGNPASWLWDFGDGHTSTEQNPAHQYAAPGNYTVTLKVSNDCDTHTETKQDYIAVIDTVATEFTAEATAGCAPLTVQFTDQSSGPVVSWLWDFGDGNTSTEQNPSHAYAAEGKYTVKLTVTNSANFSSTKTKSEFIVVDPALVAAFSGAPVTGNVPALVTFTDQSTGNPASWLWDFGDGNTSTEQNPSHTYTTAGDYTVQLTVTNACGTVTESKANYIHFDPCIAPTASFTGSPTAGGTPLTVTFADQSTGNPTSWLWDFGDGNTSTEQNPTHTYAAAGDYTVKLTATNDCNSNVATQTNYIHVDPCTPPSAKFAASSTSGSAPLTVTFTDQSTGEPTSWLWNFGDGNTSTEQNPSHEYAAAGNYTVALTVTSACDSHTETKQDFITAVGVVAAAFTSNVTSGCAPLVVEFSDQSTGPVASWLWDFGDGTTSTEQNPTHSYAAGGNYTVKLTAANSVGQSSVETKTDYISVASAPAAAFISSSTSGNAPATVNFTDQSTGNPTSWLWDFGDGNTSTEQNPAHTYAAEGNYTVQLTATNACGATVETKTNYMQVSPCIPAAAGFFASTTFGNAPLLVNFTDQSSGNPTSWLWDFGDGNTVTEQNPSHQYNFPGTYTVTLTATNSCNSDPETKVSYITVNTVPTGNLALNRPIMAANTTLPDAPELAVDSDMESYWRSGNVTKDSPNSWLYVDLGAPYNLNRAVVNWKSKYYAQEYRFQISNTASNNENDWTTVYTNTAGKEGIQDVTFTSPFAARYFRIRMNKNNKDSNRIISLECYAASQCLPPGANFAASVTSGNAPFTVSFTDQSSGNPTSWNWNFGDGNTSTERNPSHTFTAPGDYTIKLTVSDACGATIANKVNYIHVEPCLPPSVNFSASAASGNAPMTVTFTDQSNGNPTSWNWDFGDGNTSTLQNPSHTYAAAGDYTVTLTATSGCGSNSASKANFIHVEPCLLPGTNFSASVTSGNAPMTVTFTDQTTGNPISWKWNFGDGGTSTLQNPSHTYAAAGDYTVTLTATSACGPNSVTKTNFIHVEPCIAPNASFTASRVSGNAPLAVAFADQSTGNPASWKWDFGDGNTSSEQNPSHTYTAAGDYIVKLIISNACGADTTTLANAIHVEPCIQPTPGFTATTTVGNAPMAVTFTDISGGGPTSWLWEFGDDSTSTKQKPTHIYTKPGEYAVKLTVTNGCGAQTLVKESYIRVNPCLPPDANFSATVVSGNAPLTVQFVDESTGDPTAWNWEFGDGTTSTEQNPTHQYTLSGVYTVKLTVTSACNYNSETKTNYITVNGVPAGNLARGKLITASSTAAPYSPERAADGSATSYWRSGSAPKATPNAWLRVDLGGPYYLSRAVVKWKDSHFAQRYRFEVSNTGGDSDSEWTTVYTNNAGARGTQDVTFSTLSPARYFRIRMDQNNKNDNEIFELECYAGKPGLNGIAKGMAAVELPDHFELQQNYPNPFNPSTTVTFELADMSEVKLAIYNSNGQLVNKLVDGTFARGRHQIVWDATDERGARVTSGVYIAVLQANGFVAKRKLVLTK